VVEAVRASETSVNFCETTRRNIPEDSRLQEETLLTVTEWKESSIIFDRICVEYFKRPLEEVKMQKVKKEGKK
jgi:hypothetical protein